jgi:diketogulonate reductase-like aldo/keto reductase
MATAVPLLSLGTFTLRDPNNTNGGDDGSENKTNNTALSAFLRSDLARLARSIDTATCYRNALGVSDGVRSLCLTAEENEYSSHVLLLTTKLAPKEMVSRERAAAAIDAHLEALAPLPPLCSVLLLMHWPGRSGVQPTDVRHVQCRRETWAAMEDAFLGRHRGTIGALGVSNFTTGHLRDLFGLDRDDNEEREGDKPEEEGTSIRVRPLVNQVECHAHLQQSELVAFCHRHGIVLQAYSPIGSAAGAQEVLGEPLLLEIAEREGLVGGPAEVLLRWHWSRGIPVVLKAAAPDHSAAAHGILLRACHALGGSEEVPSISISGQHAVYMVQHRALEETPRLLSEKSMEDIAGLDRGHHYCWDPTRIV